MAEEEKRKHGIKSLPGNLYEAIQITEKNDLVKKALGEDLFFKFIKHASETPFCGRG